MTDDEGRWSWTTTAATERNAGAARHESVLVDGHSLTYGYAQPPIEVDALKIIRWGINDVDLVRGTQTRRSWSAKTAPARPTLGAWVLAVLLFIHYWRWRARRR